VELLAVDVSQESIVLFVGTELQWVRVVCKHGVVTIG